MTACPWGILPMSPSVPTRERMKLKRLRPTPVGVQAGHWLLPNPPQTPARAAWRAAETSTTTEPQGSEGKAGQGSASH